MDKIYKYTIYVSQAMKEITVVDYQVEKITKANVIIVGRSRRVPVDNIDRITSHSTPICGFYSFTIWTMNPEMENEIALRLESAVKQSIESDSMKVENAKNMMKTVASIKRDTFKQY